MNFLTLINIWCDHPLRLKHLLPEVHQVGLLKHLGDVATVLRDLVCLSLF